MPLSTPTGLRWSIVLVAIVLMGVVTSTSYAQTEAERATQEARQALDTQQWERARDLLKKAAETDPDNPDIHLLLGRAYYQLVALPEALDAWRTTLRLAPQQSEARRMVEALESRLLVARTQLDLAERLLERDLLDEAGTELRKLESAALNPEQSHRLQLLWARYDFKKLRYVECLTSLEALQLKAPAVAATPSVQLLRARAMLHLGGDHTRDAMAELETLAATNDTTESAAARLELVLYALPRGEAEATDLQAWVDAQTTPDSSDLARALDTLIDSLMKKSWESAPIRSDDLPDADRAAVAAMARRLSALNDVDSTALITKFVEHVGLRHTKRGAPRLAAEAINLLLATSRLPAHRLQLLPQLVEIRMTIAYERVRELISLDTVPNDAPAEVEQVLRALESWHDLEPTGGWGAQQVRIASLLAGLPAPAGPETYPPHGWAAAAYTPLIAQTTEAARNARSGLAELIQEYSARPEVERRRQAAHWQALLVDAADSRQARADAKLELAGAWTLAGQALLATSDTPPANLDEFSARALEILTELAREWAPASEPILQAANTLAQPWNAEQHDAVIERIFSSLEAALPDPARREARMALIQRSLQQARARDIADATAGQASPGSLPPQVIEALQSLEELRRDLDTGDPIVTRASRVREVTVRHYLGLEQIALARAVLEVEATPPVEASRTEALLRILALDDDAAQIDLLRRLERHRGIERLSLTEAFDTLLTDCTDFAIQHQRDRGPAIARMFGVGERYRSIGRPDIAAEVYARIEGVTERNPELQGSDPNRSNIASRAALAGADAMAERSRNKLATRGSKSAEDADIVASFDTTLRAYIRVHDIHTERPEGPIALGRALELSLDWAAVGAWSNADAVFAAFLDDDQRKPLRRPDRLEFARALCALGPVMPDHAREVLRLLLSQRQTEIALFETVAGEIAKGPLEEGGGRTRFGYLADVGTGANEVDGDPVSVDASAGLPVERTPRVLALTEAGAGPGAPATPGVFALGSTPGSRMLYTAERDLTVLAALRQHHAELATRVAIRADGEIQTQVLGQQAAEDTPDTSTVLSPSEIQRRETALERAYSQLHALRERFPDETTAEQARAEMLIIARHWSDVGEWERASRILGRFLDDNPHDGSFPDLRWENAQYLVSWATAAVRPGLPKQIALERVTTRFAAARDELSEFATEFADDPRRSHEAQWGLAQTYLREARVVAGIGPTLSRGRYARAVQGILEIARQHPELPQANDIPQTVWEISGEISSRGFHDEAIAAWSDLALNYPLNPLADQAALKVAETYRTVLGQPLRAAEAYLELNFARGGSDASLQQSIFDIACNLEAQKRWVESLHVLETFVDSFPDHEHSGAARAKIGKIHEINEAWEDAIAAYQRVIEEANDDWAREASWSIADCTINLSRWREAIDTYENWILSHPGEDRVQEAQRRIAVLKDIARYQALVDEEGQRKAFDAQFQIGRIVYEQLQNPVKAIVEYSKVAAQWPESHLADDALYTAGKIEFERGENERAREALGRLADTYPSSPMADDALLMIGRSYEDEAQQLSGVSRGQVLADSNDLAQREAYKQSQANRFGRRGAGKKRLEELRAQGQDEDAELEFAKNANLDVAFDIANAEVLGNWAIQQTELLSAAALADRQDRINASLRRAVDAFRRAAAVPSGDKADEALLKMARIQEEQLRDDEAAMQTWLAIVKEYAGTSVAEDASWKIAQAFVQRDRHEDAIEAYSSFLRNYRRSPKAGDAQYAIAENYEQLGRWVEAMDAHTKYLDNHPEGPLAQRAQQQITWIKTYRL